MVDMVNTELLVDTLTRNFHPEQWPETWHAPLEEPVKLVADFKKQKAAIDANAHLTPAGKDAARVAAGNAAIEAISKWHAPRLAALDADLGVHRTALMPTGEKTDERRVDFMLGLLQKHTPDEIAVFYNSATDDERVVMEKAAASVGRIPTKTAHGLEWKPLLDPETVHESVMARAMARNPQGAQKLKELTEIRAMHVTVAGHAVAQVQQVLAGYRLKA
jgi:hypothetical protein